MEIVGLLDTRIPLLHGMLGQETNGAGGMNSHIQPHVDAKYIEFRGKFGEQ